MTASDMITALAKKMCCNPCSRPMRTFASSICKSWQAAGGMAERRVQLRTHLRQQQRIRKQFQRFGRRAGGMPAVKSR